MHPSVDTYIEQASNWSEALTLLRRLVLDCGLEETYKWQQPCYTWQGKNILLLSTRRDNCLISFFKGALLEDTAGILVQPGPNTQVARLAAFTHAQHIREQAAILEQYVYQAIELEKAGVKPNYSKTPQPLPAELTAVFAEDPALEAAFTALTPGRQRGYLLHFSQPKQSSTRTARIEKYRSRILAGFGFHDCVCGLSRKPPGCDGSHQQLSDQEKALLL